MQQGTKLNDSDPLTPESETLKCNDFAQPQANGGPQQDTTGQPHHCGTRRPVCRFNLSIQSTSRPLIPVELQFGPNTLYNLQHIRWLSDPNHLFTHTGDSWVNSKPVFGDAKTARDDICGFGAISTANFAPWWIKS